jgi:hypothetical protein
VSTTFDFPRQRAIVGQATTLNLITYSSGTQTDIGDVTIGIVDANGDEVVAAATAVTDGADGTYSYSLAAQTDPNLLIVTWTETGGPVLTGYVEVVGSELFHESQLRAFDDAALTAASEYPDNTIRQMQIRVAEFLERETARSWIRRYCRAVVPGSGSNYLDVTQGIARTSTGLPLERPGRNRDIIRLLSATGGTSDATIGEGVIHRDASWSKATATSPYNITVEYEYGLAYPVDEVDRIAMMIARHWLVSSRVPSHAESFSDPLGSYSFGDSSKLPFEAYQWIKSRRAGGFFG